MLGRERVVALAFAAAFFVLILAPAARADTGKPSWSTGDFWEYSITMPYGGSTVTGTARTDVLGTDSVSIGTDSYASYKAKVSISITQGSTTITTSATMWNRQSDLSVVKVEYTYQDFNGNQVTTTTSFSPPLETQWPLTPGKTWTAASTVISAPNGGSYPVSASFQVQSNQQVTVPAGAFDATPLKVTGATGGTGYALLYFSGSVGNPVRMQSFDGQNVEQGKAELTKYNYAAGGLGAVLWILIIVAIVVVAVVAIGLMMRKRRKAPAGMPPSVPGQAWQQPGWQPQPQQPYQPPQQPWQPPPQGPPP